MTQEEKRQKRPTASSGKRRRGSTQAQAPKKARRPKTAGQKADAHKRPAEKRPAEKRPAEKRPADKRPAEKRPAEKRPADKRPRRAATPKPKSTAKTRPAKAKGRRRVSPEQKRRTRTLARYRNVGVTCSAILLAATAVVGLLFFARPTTSEVEKRTLTQMPEFSWNSFWSGSYFEDLALWYSDTYPVREQLVAANQKLDSLHGVKPQTQMIGGTKQADELPPAQSESTVEKSDEGQQAQSTKRDYSNVEVPDQEVMAEAIQNQVLDGLYVKGDAAYNVYYFSQEAVQEYADAINAAAKAVEGQATVYSVVAPNSSGILLSEQEVKDLGGTNQVDAIEYFYSLYDKSVHPIDSVTKLQEHTDDYIFFRTDHHWTALGAYYAYVAFCEEKGIEPESPDDMKHINMGDFLGSFYSQLNSPEMEANPDYVEAWIPNGTNKMRLWDQDGTVSDDYNVITDTSDWDITGKTMGFIMGDQPLQRIQNPKVTDGSTCLVIKDSFGDFFAPWLVDSYSTVYVGDFRYFESNIDDFVRENNVNDLIFCNNVTLAGGGVVGPSIMGRLSQI